MNGRNGIDYVEVSDDGLTLSAFFLGKLPEGLGANAPDPAGHVRIEGGERITGIQITGVNAVVDPDPEKDDVLQVTVDKPGDSSLYTLRLVGLDTIDPRYDRAAFSFAIDCPTGLDCAPSCDCEPSLPPEPDVNYLAKDYGSFRQLILDRLAVVMPAWREAHVADAGIMLVEALAYVGDYL